MLNKTEKTEATKREIQFIRENYQKMSVSSIARRLGQNEQYVRNKMSALRLSQGKTLGPQTSIFVLSTRPIFSPLNTQQLYLGLLLFIGTLWLYLHTLTPTVGFHDSGDMITAVYSLGIPHPPGYPLYCLMGKLFSFISIGNIAYRLNAMSAMFAALAVLVIYFIVVKTTSQILPAIIAGLILALTSTFWEQAVIAEKYTLNAFFMAVLIFILLKWQEIIRDPKYGYNHKHTNRTLYAFALILGLSFTHHLQTVFIIPAAIYFLLVANWGDIKKIKKNTLLKAISIFFIPIFLYLYLPVRAATHPLANWGDPATFERFIAHISAAAYKGFFSAETLLTNFINHLQFFPKQFTITFLLIGIFGAMIIFMTNRHFFIFLLIIIIADICHSVRYTIPNIEDYYIPSYMIISIWIGYGVIGVINIMRRGYSLLEEQQKKRKHPFHKSCFIIPRFVVPGIFLILLIIPFLSHYSHNNRSKYYLAYDMGLNILDPLKKNAMVITKGDDDLFPLWYHQRIENRRTDIALFNLILLQNKWHLDENKRNHPYIILPSTTAPVATSSVQDGLDDVSRTRLVNLVGQNLLINPVYSYFVESISSRYTLAPIGILNLVLPKDASQETIASQIHGEKFRCLRGIKEKITDRRGLETIKMYAMAYSNRGNTYLNLGKMPEALSDFQQMVNINPSDGDARYNLGAVYGTMQDYRKAIIEFNRSLKLKPNNISAYYGLGMCYQRIGKSDKAQQVYRKVLKLSPGDPTATAALAAMGNVQ
jgi:tetratricopeptide (TPR) repeat protein